MSSSKPNGLIWPWAIGIGLGIMILVNAVFAYVAISGADQVVSSYQTEPR